MALSFEKQPVFAIVAGLWAATNVVLSASEAVNGRRDAVLSGYLDGRALTIEHRKLIMLNDWLPMTTATGFACVVFGMLLLTCPKIFKLSKGMTFVCYALFLVPLIGAVSLLFGATGKYRLMNNVLAKCETIPTPTLPNCPH